MSESVMLCKSDVGKFLERFKHRYIFIEQKYDGVRCKAKVYNNKVEYFSRNGKQFNNFNVFNKEILKWHKRIVNAGWINKNTSLCFDAEVIAKEGDFSKVMSQVHRLSDINSDIFLMKVFDVFVAEDFISFNEIPLYYRKIILGETSFQSNIVHFVAGTKENNVTKGKIEDLLQQTIERGYEGLVLKEARSLYEFKKSAYWCKVKKTHTVDLQVTDVIEGTGKYVGTMGALQCIQDNGYVVKVGTGFTDEDRQQFWNSKPDMIEVKFQEKTKAGSLRFPVFIRERADK